MTSHRRLLAVFLTALVALSMIAAGSATAGVSSDTPTRDGLTSSETPPTLAASADNESTTNATQAQAQAQEEQKDDLPYKEQIANNSALQVEEPRDTEPIPEPTDPPAYEVLPEEVEIIRYDPETGETTSVTVQHTYDGENQTASPFPGRLSDHPAIGVGPEEMPAGEQLTPGSVNSVSRTSVISPDDRQRITATSTYPWRTVVHLRVAFPGGTGPCSGAIIDEYHVVTAGHCVYNNNFGGWVNNVTVTPGRDNETRPFHVADTTQIRTYKRWRDKGDHRYDLAVLTLDRSIGKFTGWMGRWSPSKGHPVYTTTLNNGGHPADLDAKKMWWDADSGNRSTDLKHFYEMDTAGGSSGSPVWVYDWFGKNERYQLTVHAYGIGGGLNPNSGTRLDTNKFNDIERVRQADDEIRPPTDKPDLVDDGTKWASVDKSTVAAGNDIRISTDVRNIGTATSNPSKVVYYASSNKLLTSSDTEIGTASVGNIDPFQYADAVYDGTVPSDLAAGDYYICWKVDGRMDVDEFREDNNGGCLNSQITVEEPDPIELDPGTVPVRLGATETVDVRVSGIDGGVGSYELVVNTSDASTARIVDATNRIGGTDRSEFAEGGAGVRMGAFGGDTDDTGAVTVATVTVAGVEPGTADLSVEVGSVSDETGTQYDIDARTDLATVTVQEEQPAPEVVPGSPATDQDGDGVYEDVNGDNDVTAGDATVLFNAVFEGNAAIRDNPERFDMNGDGSVTAGDATVLFQEAFGG